MKKALFLLSLVMVLFSSCESGELKNESIISEYMAIRSVTKAGEISTMSTLCVFHVNWITNVLDLKIKAIGSEKHEVDIKGIPLKATNDGYTFDVPSIIAEYNGKPSEDPLMNLTGLLYGKELKFQFTANEVQVYASVEDPSYPFASSTIADVNDPTHPFKTDKTQYRVDFDITKMTVDIHIYNAKFNSDMKAVNMTLPSIPVVATAQGFNYAIESVIPVIDKDTYPQYTMTNVSGKISSASLSLNYIVSEKYNGMVTATVHEPKKTE